MSSGLSLIIRGISNNFQMYWIAKEHGPETARTPIINFIRVKRDVFNFIPGMYFTIPIIPAFTMSWTLRNFSSILPSTFINDDETLNLKLKVLDEKRFKLSNQIIPRITKYVNDMPTTNALNELIIKKWSNKEWMRADTDVVDLYPLFKDHVNLFKISRKDAVLWCSMAGLSFPGLFPKTRLFRWTDWILKDDEMIRKESVNSLTDFEVLEAAQERAFIGIQKKSTREIRNMLMEHVQMTQRLFNGKVHNDLDIGISTAVLITARSVIKH